MPKFSTYDQITSASDYDLLLINQEPIVSTSVKTITVGNLLNNATISEATFSSSGKMKQVVFNAWDYGTIAADGVTNDAPVVNLAAAAAEAAGGGIVLVPVGTLGWGSRLVPRENVTIKGMGIDATTIKNLSTHTGDWMFLNTSNGISRFGLEDMTLDLNSSVAASGIQLRGATNCVSRRVKFKRGASSGWFCMLGVANSVTDGVLNTDNKLIDCEFDTHAGTLEALLVFNASNTQIIRPKFTSISSPSLGLWQKCYDTKIDKPVFSNCTGIGIYYSVTVENTEIFAPFFDNGGNITGANTSDNGNFGLTQAQGLVITDPKFKGGPNTINATAIQLGSVNGVTVTNPIIDLYLIGINFNTGNNSNTAAATNWTITNPQITNGNQPNSNWIIHPGIYFSGIGGSLYGKIIGGNIYDNLTGTQAYPITFDGAFTWDNIEIVFNRLSKTGGGTSVALNNSAVLGSSVNISSNLDYTGTSPSQSGYVDIASAQSITGAKNFTTDTFIGAGSAGDTGAYADIGVLGTNDVWIDARGSFTDINLKLRSKGIGTIALQSPISITDANNITLSTSTGTKIGTATSQKLGFYNSTPIIQPAITGTTAGFSVVGSSAVVAPESTFTGNTGSTAYTIGDIVKNLKTIGLLAS